MLERFSDVQIEYYIMPSSVVYIHALEVAALESVVLETASTSRPILDGLDPSPSSLGRERKGEREREGK